MPLSCLRSVEDAAGSLALIANLSRVRYLPRRLHANAGLLRVSSTRSRPETANSLEQPGAGKHLRSQHEAALRRPATAEQQAGEKMAGDEAKARRLHSASWRAANECSLRLYKQWHARAQTRLRTAGAGDAESVIAVARDRLRAAMEAGRDLNWQPVCAA